MNDLSDTAPPKRRRASRKAAKPVDVPPADAPAEAAVRAILEHALQPDAEARAEVERAELERAELERAEVEVGSAVVEASSAAAAQAGPGGEPTRARPRRAPRKRGKSAKATTAPLPQPEPAVQPAEDSAGAGEIESTPDWIAVAPVENIEALDTEGGESPAPIGPSFAEAHGIDNGFDEEGPPEVPFTESAPAEADRYEADRYEADRYEADRYEADRYEADRYEADPPPADRYHSDQYQEDRSEDDPGRDPVSHADSAPPNDHDDPPPSAPPPSHHHWVYLGLGVFLLALGFGLWGAWTVFFSGDDASGQSATALNARSETLSQEVSTLRRSDQISRDANRDLERTLAERDEEIAGLRADIAFYESFVGATGQRRGLSVHDLDMQFQGGDAWHFVATLTQNLNRGAVNTGRVTLSIEGTRNDRLEKLSWSGLRKQNNAPGVAYSFKYFQQVEGELLLPKDFKPLRVAVRLVPAGGSAVEQSFPWPDTVRSGEGG